MDILSFFRWSHEATCSGETDVWRFVLVSVPNISNDISDMVQYNLLPGLTANAIIDCPSSGLAKHLTNCTLANIDCAYPSNG